MPYGEYADISQITVVTSSLASSVVIGSNPNRSGMLFYNGSNKNLYVKFGISVTSGSMSFVLAPSGSYEDDRNCPYTGNISAVWEAAAVGSLFITELYKQ